MTTNPRLCEGCVHWVPMLHSKFLGICGLTKRCTDKLETCDRHEARAENVVTGSKIEEYLS